ncbi:MAG: Stp1/IreP family PP2C-type Ser/Thr phosphatase [Ignavibacteriaceae bacterium]
MSENQKLKIEYSGQTDIGMVRTDNQDSLGKFPPDGLDIYQEKGVLFVVADGMGGHTGGKQASSIAVETTGTVYYESSRNPSEALKEAIISANKKIFRTAETTSGLSKMGTTCTALVMVGDQAIIGHVGDSRIYRIENGKIEQLTNDHTKVQEMLREGVLTPEEAKVYPSKSVLARALGVEENVKVDIISNIPLKSGQKYLICSDGLAKVKETEILNIITENSIEASCKKFVALANERGGKDNVTVQIISVESQDSEVFSDQPEKSGSGKSKMIIFSFLLIALIAFGVYQFRDSLSGLFSSKEINNNENNVTISDGVKNEIIDNHVTSGLHSELLQRANKYYENGRIETALDLYKGILDEEPMNLAALQGINNISAYYLKNADELRSENRFEEALSIYQLVNELQPGNEKVRNLILICEDQLNNGNPEHQSPDNSDSQIKLKESNVIIVTDFLEADWNFINIPSNQYNIEPQEIEFSASSIEKKSLFRQELFNAELSVELKTTLPDNNSMSGIIVGYNQQNNEKPEEYYLLSIHQSILTLNRISDNKSEQLLKMNSPQMDNKSAGIKLKILCSDNRIFIFSVARLLGNWEGKNNIAGKVGFIAGPDVHAKFYNMHLKGIRR